MCECVFVHWSSVIGFFFSVVWRTLEPTLWLHTPSSHGIPSYTHHSSTTVGSVNKWFIKLQHSGNKSELTHIASLCCLNSRFILYVCRALEMSREARQAFCYVCHLQPSWGSTIMDWHIFTHLTLKFRRVSECAEAWTVCEVVVGAKIYCCTI